MLFDLGNTVFVFDLDDTLYPEADYVDSGVRYVCKQIEGLFGLDIYSIVKKSLDQDSNVDWLASACELVNLPTTAKDSLLWMYRLHFPHIGLSVSCKEALKIIRSTSKAVAILTDGRSVTQRLKLKALGLSDWPVYISEDYGAPKPSPDRFKAIQKDYPARHYLYLADNIQKDFVSCNSLGWIGIGMRANSRNVYSQTLDGFSELALPAHWVHSWDELTELLFNDKTAA